MNILILELGGSHSEIIHPLILLLNYRKAEIHIACNNRLMNLLPEGKSSKNLLGLPDQFTFKTQLKTFWKIRKYIKVHNIQTLIIGTTEINLIRNFSLFIPSINTIGVIHNAKKLEEKWTSKRIAFNRIKKFLLVSNHLTKEINPIKTYRIASLPAIYFPKLNKSVLTKNPNEFWITVPGEVISARRDYLCLFEQMIKSKTSINIKIVLLGRYNEKEESQIKTYLDLNDSLRKQVITFENYLSFNDFHSYIQLSDVILPLVKLSGDTFYSNKRISGSFNLGLAYKIPFLLPITYTGNIDINPYSILYKDYSDLFNRIEAISKDDMLLKNIKAVYATDEKLDIKFQSNKLYEFITEKL